MTTPPEIGHGRIDIRELRIAEMEAESCGMPYSRRVVSIYRKSTNKKTGKVTIDTRYFITSLDDHQASAEHLERLGRGHWSVENKNHWRRDATLWREDATRLRTPKAAFNLALLRNALLALIPPEFKPLATAFEHYNRHSTAAIALLKSTRPLI
ncbi:MAG: ISAs1 family transposase [Verrucomicrobiales bacterium]|nr:ISAs1 family transposase [Verrucomicrobiales bacterium]